MSSLYLALGVLCGLLSVLFVPVRVRVFYGRLEGEGETLDIVVSLPFKSYSWGWYGPSLVSWSRVIDIILATPEPDDNSIYNEKQYWPAGRSISYRRLWSLGLRSWRKLAVLWGQFLGKVRCERFRWVLEIGTGDPAATGLAAGLLWNTAALICMNLHRQTRQKGWPELKIIPYFNGSRCQSAFHCTFTFTLGHIIIAGLKSLRLVWKAMRKLKGIL